MSVFKVFVYLWTVLTVINKYTHYNYTYKKYNTDGKIAKAEN